MNATTTVVCLLLLTAVEASAATRTWTRASAANHNWTTAGNWDVPPVAGDDLVFPAGGSNNDFPAGTKFNSITFTSSNVSVTGNAIALGAGGIVSNDANNDHGAFDVDIALTQNTTFTQNGASEIVFSGDISGPFSLTKTGSGIFVPAHAMTYSGGTLLLAGHTFITGKLGAVSISAGDVELFANSVVGDLVSTGGLVNLQNQTATASSLVLGAGSTFSSVPGSGLFHITGNVTLGNATRAGGGVSTSLVSPAYIVLIDNQGTAPVNGIFAGMPEATTVPGSGSGSTTYISYRAGDGNDVVLFVGTATNTVLTASANPAALGENVTLTATVTSLNPLTGNVTFYDGTTMLGTGSLTAGVATYSTSSLAPGTHALNARYAGNATYAASAGILSLVVSTSSDLSGPPDLAVPAADDLGVSASGDLGLHDDLSAEGSAADMAAGTAHHSGCAVARSSSPRDAGVALYVFALLCAFVYRRARKAW